MDTMDRLNKNLDYLTGEINSKRYSIAFTGTAALGALALTIGAYFAGYIFLPWVAAMGTLLLIIVAAKDHTTLTMLRKIKTDTEKVGEARAQLDKDINQAIAQANQRLNHQH